MYHDAGFDGKRTSASSKEVSGLHNRTQTALRRLARGARGGRGAGRRVWGKGAADTCSLIPEEFIKGCLHDRTWEH